MWRRALTFTSTEGKKKCAREGFDQIYGYGIGSDVVTDKKKNEAEENPDMGWDGFEPRHDFWMLQVT